VTAGFGRHGMPTSACNLTFDRLTLKLVCESHLRWATFLPNLGTLNLWVLELFAMYATDGQTDGRTKATLIAPFPTVEGIIIISLRYRDHTSRDAICVAALPRVLIEWHQTTLDLHFDHSITHLPSFMSASRTIATL